MKGLALSLIDALKTPPPPRHRIDAILAEVSGPEQQALRDALSAPEWTHQALADVLTDSGHKISEASVRRYRRASQ